VALNSQFHYVFLEEGNVKERPILFSTEMVQAILAGRKTQTRRVVAKYGKDGRITPDQYHKSLTCPYGVPGDRLWVREAWKIGAWREDGRMAIDYKASPELVHTPWVTIPDDPYNDKFNEIWRGLCDHLREINYPTSGDDDNYHWEPGQSPFPWRPSIFMPRWASRINLEIVNIRVEQVRDISKADAYAEGIRPDEIYYGYAIGDPVISYAELWDKINAKRAGCAWIINPWVWVIEFKKI
jgi:hypothetical protein